MSDKKSKSQLFARKLLKIAENSIDLYCQGEQKKSPVIVGQLPKQN